METMRRSLHNRPVANLFPFPINYQLAWLTGPPPTTARKYLRVRLNAVGAPQGSGLLGLAFEKNDCARRDMRAVEVRPSTHDVFMDLTTLSETRNTHNQRYVVITHEKSL